MSRILIVEDEPKLAALLLDYFSQAGFDAQAVHRGDEAMAAFRAQNSELVVLDLQLPGQDGLSLCRELRACQPTPAIMMLTARVDEMDRLLGLELGADDYVCKPFSPREVVARARAILRRTQPAGDIRVLTLGRLQLDLAARQLTAAGQVVSLTPHEFEMLRALIEQPNRVWTRAQLQERASGARYAGYERNVDGHVKNLRRKLRQALDGDEPIRSVYGVGYAIEAG